MARILYVDDEADIREVAEMAIQLHPDLEVRCCASGQEGLELAAQWQHDLILLDVMMPGMDGPTTLAALRAQESTSLIPVVFITARTQATEIDGLISAGALGVIPKPFDPMTLAQSVRTFLPNG